MEEGERDELSWTRGACDPHQGPEGAADDHERDVNVTERVLLLDEMHKPGLESKEA